MIKNKTGAINRNFILIAGALIVLVFVLGIFKTGTIVTSFGNYETYSSFVIQEDKIILTTNNDDIPFQYVKGFATSSFSTSQQNSIQGKIIDDECVVKTQVVCKTTSEKMDYTIIGKTRLYNQDGGQTPQYVICEIEEPSVISGCAIHRMIYLNPTVTWLMENSATDETQIEDVVAIVTTDEVDPLDLTTQTQPSNLSFIDKINLWIQNLIDSIFGR